MGVLQLLQLIGAAATAAKDLVDIVQALQKQGLLPTDKVPAEHLQSVEAATKALLDAINAALPIPIK